MTKRGKFNDASKAKKKNALAFKSFTVTVEAGSADRKRVNPKVAQCANQIRTRLQRLKMERHLDHIRPLYRSNAIIVSCTEEALREIAKIKGVEKVAPRDERKTWRGDFNSPAQKNTPKKPAPKPKPER